MAEFEDNQGQDLQKPLDNGGTTPRILSKAIEETKTDYKGQERRRWYIRLKQDDDCNEVYPGIYIGNGATAKNKEYLKKIGITSVLNAAEGSDYGYVNTNHEFYHDTNMKYLGFQLDDCKGEDISKYFYEAADFIEDALSTSSGKAYVHCMMGISRSATFVIAFLMIKRHMSAEEAIRLIRKIREIEPNYGFLGQLATLDNQLRRQRR